MYTLNVLKIVQIPLFFFPQREENGYQRQKKIDKYNMFSVV